MAAPKPKFYRDKITGVVGEAVGRTTNKEPLAGGGEKVTEMVQLRLNPENVDEANFDHPNGHDMRWYETDRLEEVKNS